ncbi:MAG: electron transfer flavoprotein subunit beta/FixA family protein [Clostridiales bacterium]|nr:electron transfer flavoprotein subunit beta/FixA family protein [Clostridiales bacterium]
MNIIVCIKQVPAVSVVGIDEETGVLLREGARTKLNPYDLYALEAAFLLREQHGGTVTAVTMGPPQAVQAVREAYYMGADEGYVFSDAKFAGADVLATSYTVSQGIRLLGRFDLIICGKQTTDGDTAQVGPAVAEYLGIPHVAWVLGFEGREDGILVQQDLPDSCETAFMKYPCLITVERGALVPRLPSYRRMKEMRDKPVGVLSIDDFLDRDEGKYGLAGSPTRVVEMFAPQPNEEHEVWAGEGAALAARISGKLREMKYI